MEKQNKEKMNLSFAPEIKEYLINQSEIHGMSVSSFLTMLVCIHRQQQEENTVALANSNTLLNEIERLKQMISTTKQPTL